MNTLTGFAAPSAHDAAAGAPIDVFGVGTELAVSRDDPTLAAVYKLVEQETDRGPAGRVKLAEGKRSYPFAKQVYRRGGPDGAFSGDVVARDGEPCEGEPLLAPAMRQGRPVEPLPTLEESRTHCRRQIGRLPRELLDLGPAPAYPVGVSAGLEAALRSLEEDAASPERR